MDDTEYFEIIDSKGTSNHTDIEANMEACD